jgi:fused signal recognition particle receptor
MPSPSLGARLRAGLARTRAVLETPVEELIRGRRPLDPADLETIEESLLAADMGVPAVERAMAVLRAHGPQIVGPGPAAMRSILQEEIRKALSVSALPPAEFSSRPWVVLVVGVNGVGKTTTIGKLASSWASQGRSTLLCAADTFRAAAAEQLEIWAERVGGDFLRGAEGADPSAVLTDALRAAAARGRDAVLVDTAGRLHTRGNLMAELSKMARVAGREVDGAPHETLLVLDATTGSNALAQAREFARAVNVTGLVLTKLDGTAKGGMAVAVVQELGVPIRYVGVGEALDDLLPFHPDQFAAGLLGEA